VSVVIPAYNAAAYIKQTVLSVLNQTYENLEVIIIDDGSTDCTKAKISSFNDPRIIYVEQPNSGQCKASNLGIKLSKGKYIKFLDADDLINCSHIELMVRMLQKEQNAICGCEWSRFYNNDLSTMTTESQEMWNYHLPIEWLKHVLQQKGNMMSAWLWLIPRRLLDEVGYWDERLSLNNDFEFSCRLLLHVEKVVFAGGAQLFYRTGGETLSVTKTKKAYEAAYLSTQLGCEHLLKAEDSILMKRICANRYQSWVFQIYPSYPKLYKEMEIEIKRLGGSTLILDGGVFLKILIKLFGWKIAKRIQKFFYRLGYFRIINRLNMK
jgi:glycosyltransferase involved in cell wall biosynthesis